MAGSLEEAVREDLGNAIRALAHEARTDWRPEIRRVVAAENRGRTAAKDPVPVPAVDRAVADANRAIILAAMER